jgi:hypothetical protein
VELVDQLAEALSAGVQGGAAADMLSLLATYVVTHGFIYYAMSKWAFDMSNSMFEMDT